MSAFIPLFYWSEKKFVFKDKENYGDLLSKYLVEKISGRPVKFMHPKEQSWFRWDKTHYLAIGSIIHHATKNSIVWGSGIIDRKQKVAPAEFRAVRGPKTREYLLELNYKCSAVYGDPALLLPKYYDPFVNKSYKLGIVPHYHDYAEVVEIYREDTDILVIDMMTLDVEEVTRQILKCEKVISSSLHGLIVAHAYQIPAVWVEFSKKLFGDGIKFVDYLESVKLDYYIPQFLKEKYHLTELITFFEKYPSLPRVEHISFLQEGLIRSCPFLNSKEE